MSNQTLDSAKAFGVQLKIQFDEKGLLEEIDRRTAGAQKVLDAQVLKDCNRYVPMDTSTLQKSAILATVIGSGVITWKTPYAREQYYMYPNKSHQRNPNATMRWCEVAKSKCLPTWERIIHGQYRQNSK